MFSRVVVAQQAAAKTEDKRDARLAPPPQPAVRPKTAQPHSAPVPFNLADVPLFASGEYAVTQAQRACGPVPLPWPIQAKLEIGAVDHPLEREADRVAERVMHMPDPAPISSGAGGEVLSRTCKPGAEEEEQTVRRKCQSCSEEEQRKTKEDEAHEKLSRKKSSGAAALDGTATPAIVQEVLRSPGQPLDPLTRAFLEPLFGHDFSRVRVHTDARAAESADAVQAHAYTVGHNIVFGAGRFAPATSDGRRLLAHEITHVVQQNASTPAVRVSDSSDVGEQETGRVAGWMRLGGSANATAPLAQPVQAQPATGPRLSRKVVPGKVHCTPGTHGAPKDPVAELTSAEGHAQGLAQGAAILTVAESAAMTIGVHGGAHSGVRQAYEARFGLPPAVRGGFMNRLSGKVVAARDDAINGELDLLGDRLELINTNFDSDIHYWCIGGATTIMGCSPDCAAKDAFACPGIRAIFLCPGFWRVGDSARATLLIHEAAHMIWARVLHGAHYTHASCYANFVADLFNAPLTGPACPVPTPPTP